MTQEPFHSNLLFAIQQAADVNELESLGKHLSSPHFLALLDACQHQKLPSDKLLPLFVGMPHAIFQETLAQSSPEQLELLKQEGTAEPLQHHLYLVASNYEALWDRRHNEMDTLQRNISSLDPTQLTYDTLNRIEQQIESIQVRFEKELEILDKALAIAWIGQRSDLIQKLSHLKEHGITLAVTQVGQPRKESQAASGLFAILEEHLMKVYGAYVTQSQEFSSLADTDSSMEALARFSIWYLKDYWELGLIPSVKQPEKVELNLSHKALKSRSQEHQKMVAEIQANLDQLNIGSVRELKQAKIFSKHMLKAYLEEKRKKGNKAQALDIKKK